jgi:hypothetical protein
VFTSHLFTHAPCTCCLAHVLRPFDQDLALFSAEKAAASGAVASATYGDDVSTEDRERTLQKGIARLKLRAISTDNLMSLDLDESPNGGEDGDYDNMSNMQPSDSIEVFGFGTLLSDEEDEENVDGSDE